MTRPTVAQAETWRPGSLREAAERWNAAATDVHASIEIAVQGAGATREFWTGSTADAARRRGPRAHSDVIDHAASDSWRNILAVITGDRQHIELTNQPG